MTRGSLAAFRFHKNGNVFHFAGSAGERSGKRLPIGAGALGWNGSCSLEHQTEIGDYLRLRLVDSGWELLNITPLPVICFTHPLLDFDNRHQAVVRYLLKRQIAWISRISFGKEHVGLRASITNYNTRREDIDVLVSSLDEAVRSLDR